MKRKTPDIPQPEIIDLKSENGERFEIPGPKNIENKEERIKKFVGFSIIEIKNGTPGRIKEEFGELVSGGVDKDKLLEDLEEAVAKDFRSLTYDGVSDLRIHNIGSLFGVLRGLGMDLTRLLTSAENIILASLATFTYHQEKFAKKLPNVTKLKDGGPTAFQARNKIKSLANYCRELGISDDKIEKVMNNLDKLGDKLEMGKSDIELIQSIADLLNT